MRARRILVVDDEPDILETLRFRFEIDGFEVLTADNGLDAIVTARREQPDLLVLDVMLPGENGYRVAKRIREEEQRGNGRRHLPIILLTARDLSSDPEREEAFMNFSRADAMMYKPCDLEDLVRRAKELLAARPAAARER